MKVWLVVLSNHSEPEQKVYLLGAHSSQEGARQHKDSIDVSHGQVVSILDMEVDGKQPPILIGVAPSSAGQDCKKNTPNG